MTTGTNSLGVVAGGSAAEYLRRLSELMLRMEVIDGEGEFHELDEGAAVAVDMMLAVRSAGKKIMIVGNGGSESVAAHLQTDLCNAVGLRALTFDGPGIMTALSNDHGYDSVFERPIRLWADSGDLLLAISSSGESENILRAVQAARGCGSTVITLSGFSAVNRLRRTGDLNFYVPSETYGLVEVAHAALAHFLADGAMLGRLQQVPRVTAPVWSPSSGPS